MLLNSQSLPSKFDEIYNFVITASPLLVCLTETRLTEDINDFEINIQGYQIIRVDSENRFTGGVAIYIKECVDLMRVEKYQYQKNYWFVVIKIKVFGKSVIVGNLYHSPSSSDSEFLEFFEHWCEDLTDKEYPVLIMGDFNLNWLSQTGYSAKLKRIVGDSGFQQIVKDVTHPTEQGGSIIDLVFSNRKDIFEGLVWETPRIRDHFIVGINILSGDYCKNNLIVNTRGRIDYKRVNEGLSSVRWEYGEE